MDKPPWQPIDLKQVIALFGDAPFRWWISGGLALELHLGRSWRRHDDTDVGILRSDGPAVFKWLEGWQLSVASRGELTKWSGEPLATGQNNVWVRHRDDGPWMLDITVGSGTETEWVYRRNPALTRPWSTAVLTTDNGVPYLAPDLQMLFKSKSPRPKDDEDADEVLPNLTLEEHEFLAVQLPSDHPWLRHGTSGQ